CRWTNSSFANGGLITPSMSDPWNAPGVHRHLLEYVISSSSALKIRLKALPSLLSWGPQFLLNSRPQPYRTATLANLDLSTYSLAVLNDLKTEFQLSFDSSDNGTLKIFRSTEALDTALKMTRFLEEHGLKAKILDRHETVTTEPCLTAIRDDITGAIYYPRDASGDAHLYCRAVAKTIKRLGGVIEYNRTVQAIESRNGHVSGVRLQDDFIAADEVIIAAGVTSPELASKLSLKLRVKPVKGYSVTYNMDTTAPTPNIPVVDDALHTAVTPLGSRLRVAGTAEFAGNDTCIDHQRIANLTNIIKAIYPDLVNDDTSSKGVAWAGLRAVSADGRPYIGPGNIPGLWINTGHGHLGWTMAAGSARMLVDIINGTATEINPKPFATNR
ncbi:MAG: FAD-dependent oxidoreductase, partial [Emcibacter sp.]|nr:FAD-dependent oxidoreductase [Emcibacter sp.]